MATTFDVHFQLIGDPLEQQGSGKYFTFGFTTAVGVRGPQKLINRWIKCLLTPQGTDPYEPAYGTGFSNLLGSNITRDNDVQDAVAIFIEECNEQIRNMDRKNFPPDDERLKSASIFRIVERSRDGFDVYVHIRNMAGQVLTLQLPAVATRL